MQLYVHIIFSTKDRRPYMQADVSSEIFAYLGGGFRDEGYVPIIVNGVADHVHALVVQRPDKGIADVLRDVKANSSGWIHRRFPQLSQFAWQQGYGVFSVSQSQLEIVTEYIAKQEEHHRKMSFQEEFVQLLRNHGVEFDERYLWK